MENRLRELRKEHRLSQQAIASRLEMSQTGYSKYETGRNDISTVVLQRLADFYETSVDYLLGRTNERKPYPKPWPLVTSGTDTDAEPKPKTNLTLKQTVMLDVNERKTKNKKFFLYIRPTQPSDLLPT